MKAKKLIELISIHCPKVKPEIEWDDRIIIKLPDNGELSLGIDPPNRVCKFPFLWFNIWGSPIRVTGQDAYNGKLNYFKNDAEEKLIELLVELNNLI
jgi:hypothetical protein